VSSPGVLQTSAGNGPRNQLVSLPRGVCCTVPQLSLNADRVELSGHSIQFFVPFRLESRDRRFLGSSLGIHPFLPLPPPLFGLVIAPPLPLSLSSVGFHGIPEGLQLHEDASNVIIGVVDGVALRPCEVFLQPGPILPHFDQIPCHHRVFLQTPVKEIADWNQLVWLSFCPFQYIQQAMILMIRIERVTRF